MQQEVAEESRQNLARDRNMVRRVQEERQHYRRELLQQMSGDQKRRTQTKQAEVCKDLDVVGLPLESYRPNRTREHLRDDCRQFNHERAEARRARTPLPEPSEPIAAQDGPDESDSQRRAAFAEAQKTKERWNEYYRDEIKLKEQQRLALREKKFREQRLVAERIQEIQQEIQEERRRVRQNQGEIRQILNLQLQAKKAARELERSADRGFREELERSSSPLPLPDRPKCKRCQSPIK